MDHFSKPCIQSWANFLWYCKSDDLEWFLMSFGHKWCKICLILFLYFFERKLFCYCLLLPFWICIHLYCSSIVWVNCSYPNIVLVLFGHQIRWYRTSLFLNDHPGDICLRATLTFILTFNQYWFNWIKVLFS